MRCHQGRREGRPPVLDNRRVRAAQAVHRRPLQEALWPFGRRDEILIINGSQQGLDLIGKIFIDPGDPVALERPGYLGAIQAFSLFEPKFRAISLHDDGPDTGELSRVLQENNPKIFYGIPNSQNPSGITYSEQKRRELGKMLSETDTVFVEDDALGELRFDGTAGIPVTRYLPGEGIMMGSFSKIFSPGMRLGWLYAPEDIMEKLIVAKQASDLHSNYLSQRILAQYLEDNDIDAHIRKITAAYSSRAALMATCLSGPHSPKASHRRNFSGKQRNET